MEQESAGRITIQLLNLDHNNFIVIRISYSCFFLRTLHLFPFYKLVHSILNFLNILNVQSILSNITVLSIPPLSCLTKCLSPET
jgi:hypothetical protein